MTNQELGHLYRAFLYANGFFSIAETLSDEAAFNLYEEIERFGFNYYIDRYKKAEDDKKNGLDEEIEKLDNLFCNRAKVLLEMSGKDNYFISSNYEKFAEKLKYFYLSERNQKIHEQIKDDSLNFDSIIADFDNIQLQNDTEEKADDEAMEETIQISTLEDFMKLIEDTTEIYDDILEKYDLSEEQKASVLVNKENKINELKMQFTDFLSNYYEICFKAFVDVNSDEASKEHYMTEIKKAIDVCRDFLGDEELAKYLEDRFNSAMNMSVDKKDEFDSEKISEDLKNEVSPAHLVTELKSLETKEIIGKSNVISEEEAKIEKINFISKDDIINKTTLDIDNNLDEKEDAVVEGVSDEAEVDSDGLEESLDYSQMSNDELFSTLNILIDDIKKASAENSSNLNDLIETGNRLQAELDNRIAALTNSQEENVEDLEKVEDDLAKEEEDLTTEEARIRSSRHFTPEVKEQLIAELYADEGNDKEARHMR